MSQEYKMDHSPPLFPVSAETRRLLFTLYVCLCNCVHLGLKGQRNAEWSESSLSMIALILSHFPLHSLLFLSVFPPHNLAVFLFLSLFSTTCLSPLAAAVLSCVTFPLIYPFSCNRNHPRYSLISGQSYQPLFSELGLIAGMIMTHRMGS